MLWQVESRNITVVKQRSSRSVAVGFVLVLLDTYADFDTVDQAVLLSRVLNSRPGIIRRAFAWYKSYLTKRKQSVFIQMSGYWF